MLCLIMHCYVIKLSVINTVEKDYIPDVKLNISKLCKNLKERNVNIHSISDIHLLNIGKTPNLNIHVLRTASTAREDEIYKEAEELSKHLRTQTLYRSIMG